MEEWSEYGRISVDLDAEVSLLLKLHGSMNWRLHEPGRTQKPMKYPSVTETSWRFLARGQSTVVGRSTPGLVFGSRSKLRPDGPFLALLRAFSDALAGADVVTVIGYSFRDAHINNELTTWINADSTRKLRIIDPSFLQSPVPYAQQLRESLSDRMDVYAVEAREGIEALFGT
jgi:hypothetical protein